MIENRSESDFLAYLAEFEISVFTLQKALEYWKHPSTTAKAISRLIKKKRIKRIERGKYLFVPEEAGREWNWTESAFVVAPYLVEPSAIAYWSAMRFWNLTEQIPRTVFIQTTKRKRNPQVSGVPYRFITILPKHFFGIVTRKIDGKVFQITDLEKTLIDAAARPDLCGGIHQLIQALDFAKNEINLEKTMLYFNKWGGGVIIKRLGFLIDALKIEIPEKDKYLPIWKKQLSKGINLLEPGLEKRGRINFNWQIMINVSISKEFS